MDTTTVLLISGDASIRGAVADTVGRTDGCVLETVRDVDAGLARLGQDDVRMALVHLAAAIRGSRGALPPPALDSRFFHAEYHETWEPEGKKARRGRIYDSAVY